MAEKEGPIAVSLDNLLNGGAVEKFQHELENVLENILDPNTDAEAKREVVLTVKIKPTLDRDQGAVSVSAISKLAPVTASATQFFIGKKDGKAVALEHNPKQMQMAFNEQKTARPDFPKAADDNTEE